VGRKLFSNNAISTLAGSISNVATSCAATSGGGARFPAISGGSGDTFQATLVKAGAPSVFEIVTVTARATDTFTIVRGQEGTTALAWSAGDFITKLPTALDFQSMLQAGDIQAQGQNFALDTGTANAYAVVVTPALTSRVLGTPIRWKAANSNTGASTFNDGIGTVALKTPAGAALTANMVVAAGMYESYWNGANYTLTTPDWAAFANAAAAAAQAAAISAAETFSANAANLTSGTVANARLPNVAAGPGVTIAVDPGTTPTGTFGQLFLYY
jgi:hypothetical protein